MDNLESSPGGGISRSNWSWPLENHPEVISYRTEQWSQYKGDYPIRMVHGQELYLCPNDDYSKTLFTYRRQHVGLLLALARVEVNGIAIDVGANVGYISAWLGNRPDVTEVFSFEPNSRISHFLRKNVPSEKSRIIEKAVSSLSGKTDLKFDLTNSGWSGPPVSINDPNVSEVPAVSIDDFLGDVSTQMLIPPGGLIKIDTEGAEVAVLEGARATIDEFGPVLVVEINRNTKDLSQVLENIRKSSRHNYRLFMPNHDGFLVKKSSVFDVEGSNDVILVPQRVSVRL